MNYCHFQIAMRALWCLTWGPVWACCAADPQLVINSHGHHAVVNQVVVLPGRQQLASASDDKSIRIWDLPSGECVSVLRPWLGEGPNGKLYSLAASPDGQWLAAGGFGPTKNRHSICLIDLPNQRLVRSWEAHRDVILDIEFSVDGTTLASASADRTIALWNMKTLRLEQTLGEHRDRVNGIAFFPNCQALASVSSDGNLRIWSLIDGGLRRTIQCSSRATSVAVNATSDLIAVGGADQSLSLWTADGQQTVRMEKFGNEVTSVSFVPQREQLLLTLGGAGNVDEAAIINVRTLQTQAFHRHANTITAGTLTPDGTAAVTADADGEIHVWQTNDGALRHRFPAGCPRILSVAWPQPQVIAWGHTSNAANLNNRGPLEMAIDLSTWEFDPAPQHLSRLPSAQRDEFVRIVAKQPQSLQCKPFSDAEVFEYQLPDPLDQIRCYAMLEDALLVGSDSGLRLVSFDKSSATTLLEGPGGGVWAIAVSPDGKRAVSAGDDRIMRIWSIDDRRLIASLFSVGREWIAWTPSGAYAASPGGEKLIAWCLNQEFDQLASVQPAAHYHRSLYQPERISSEILGMDLRSLPLAAVRLPAQEASISQLAPPEVQILEPATSPWVTNAGLLTVRAMVATQRPGELSSVRILLNGRPFEGRKGVQVVPHRESATIPARQQFTWQIELEPGRYQISVRADSTRGQSMSESVEVDCRSDGVEAVPRLPDLYVLSIGVAEYPGSLRLSFADKDAVALNELLAAVSRPLYRRVHSKLLTNRDASRREILAGLAWLRSHMTQFDVAVIFFSGHGIKDEAGDFYLLPADGDVEDLLTSCVPGVQFKETLGSIPGRIVVMLDACHAGASGGDRRKSGSTVADDLVRDLVSDDYGVVVMCSSLGREFSMESAEHHQGYFTVALLEGLRGQADFNQDGLVYLSEMDAYLADRVKALTGGRQHPVTSKPSSIRSFPLGKVH